MDLRAHLMMKTNIRIGILRTTIMKNIVAVIERIILEVWVTFVTRKGGACAPG